MLKRRIFETGNQAEPVVLHDEHREKTHLEETIPGQEDANDMQTSDMKVAGEHVTKDIFETASEEKPDTVTEKKESIDRKTKTDLIDQFIENEPSISRQKETFFNPVTAAKSSITDQENIISETLAQIYLDQGFIDKAISTYRKLSLKYPEKSTYFAALIEKAGKKRES
jgi:hypothetical protein